MVQAAFDNNEIDEVEEIDDNLLDIELYIKHNDLDNEENKNFVFLFRSCLKFLPPYKMDETPKEAELRSNIIDSIMNHVFSPQDSIKYRSPEINLPERTKRTENLKKPDSMISAIEDKKYIFTKAIGEVKNDTYKEKDVEVANNKYRLALFGKDCLDSGVENAVFYSVVGTSMDYYYTSLVEEGFYVAVFLFSVKLPSCIADLPSFVREAITLFKAKDIIKNRCIQIERPETIRWRRETLDTPSFLDIIELSSSSEHPRQKHLREN